MRQPLTLLAIGAVLTFSIPARAQSAEVKKYLNAAVTLYENLEYEKAIKQIQRAKTKSTGATDDARIALYEGIVFADMGKEEQALNAFKTGLSMEPEAKLPLEVSPKVENVFNRARENVHKLLGPQLQKERDEEKARVAAQIEADKQRIAEEQRKKDAEAARLAAIKPAEPDRPPPAVVVAPAPGPGLRPMAIIPLVIGVGSGAAAAYFLVSARGKEAALNNGTAPQAQALAYRSSGKTDALLGYVFTGVAVAGVATAGLMFGLGGSKAPPVTILAGPGQVYVGFSGTLP